MHELYNVIKGVELTHARLGKALAFALLCVKAKKCLLIVAPAGTGKSTITWTLNGVFKEAKVFDSVTRSGLAFFQDELQSFRSVAIIDDMGKIDTPYSRMATLSTFAELCYSHFIAKHTISTHIEINDYQGSAVLNVQPAILAFCIAAAEWEAVIMDKTVRYYHLYRPLKPQRTLPKIEIESNITIDEVELTGMDGKRWDSLLTIGHSQWSDARALEHIEDLLKSAAAWDGRKQVDVSDYKLIWELIRPLQLERYLVQKYGLESDRVFELDLLALIVERASWNKLDIKRVCRDYKCSPSTVYQVVARLTDYFSIGVIDPNRIRLTPRTKEILKLMGVKV